MEYKFDGCKLKFVLMQIKQNLTLEHYDNLFDIVRKYQMPTEDISKIPYISATEFPECSGNDSDYVFIIKTNETLDSTQIDDWKQVFASLSETKEDSRFMIICGDRQELIRIKRILLPLLVVSKWAKVSLILSSMEKSSIDRLSPLYSLKNRSELFVLLRLCRYASTNSFNFMSPPREQLIKYLGSI